MKKKIVMVLLAVMALGVFGACQAPGGETVTVCYQTVGGGRIEGEKTQTITVGEDASAVRAVANEGCYFAGWSDGVKSAIRQDAKVRENLTVTAVFEKQGLSVRYESGEGGQVVGEAEQTVRYGENASAVTAVPDEGWEFVGWSDGVQTAQRQDSRVLREISATATFEKRQLAVDYGKRGGGRIEGKSRQTISYGENASAVTAVPNEGYEFVRWSDGVETAKRQDMGIREDLFVTAEFQKRTLSVRYESSFGGQIQGITEQTVTWGEDGQTVTAVPDEGYEFAGWSDGSTEPTRAEQDVRQDITLAAVFERKVLEVEYRTNRSGEIRDVETGEPVEVLYVLYGEDAPKVKAVAGLNMEGQRYVFLGWSDGVLTEERQDTGITEPLVVYAVFGYQLKYGTASPGGRIEGETEQNGDVSRVHTLGEPVRAVPEEGYRFAGWSDRRMEAERQDEFDLCNKEFFAYFEPVVRTFALNYMGGSSEPLVPAVTLAREQIGEAEFPVPVRVGYTFLGWYADREYQVRITTESGRYMHGYAAFTLETDTLYARWQREGEKSNAHKILLVFVDEIQATLKAWETKEMLDVHRRMNRFEYLRFGEIAVEMRGLLNEWFEGIVSFEVDAYYTTQPVREGFDGINTLDARDIKELQGMAHTYHSTVTAVGYGEYKEKLVSFSGAAQEEACVIFNDKDGVGGFLHELSHTVEQLVCPNQDTYHLAIRTGYPERDVLSITKQYLLGQYEWEGVTYGIPREYWLHQMKFGIVYSFDPYSPDIEFGENGGRVRIVDAKGNDDVRELDRGIVSGEVVSGAEIIVEAEPLPGYRFVCWSDGVTTALRHDVNVISYIHVQAIFEKI